MPRILRWLGALCVAVTAVAAWAQEIDVSAVQYAKVRAPLGGIGSWIEATVQLTVRPAPGSPGSMVSRVRVALLLGYEIPAQPGGERRLEHYRADAECVALEAGRAEVRFYLPPELVKRDQLPADPKFWGTEVSVAGRAIAAGRHAYVATLATPEQRRAFQSRAGASSAVNDGILLPQYLTPFANEYPRTTPAFVRRPIP